MNKKAKNASSKCADEQDAGEAMDSAAVREQPNQGDEFLLALGKFGSHLEEGLRLKKRKRDKNQLNINSYFGGEEAVPLSTLETVGYHLESLRRIRNALRRVNDGMDKAIRDAEQEMARQGAMVDHGMLSLPGFGITGDLLEKVLHQLSMKELVRLGLVCKGWREVMARPEVYREFNVPDKMNRITLMFEVLKQPRFRMLQSFTLPEKTIINNTFFSKLAVSEFGNWSNIDEAGEGLLHGLTRVIRANQQLESLEYKCTWICAGRISSEFMQAVGALPHLKTLSLTGPTYIDVLNLLRACPTLEEVTLCHFPKVHTELLSMGITLQEAASEIVSLKCSLQLSGELANQLFH